MGGIFLMTVTWQKTPEEAFTQLTFDYIDAMRWAIYQLGQRYAAEIEYWMKENAIWTDRTSNARQTLSAEVEQLATGSTKIIMAHGMEYGIFLELAHAGKWAIIGPALDYFAPKIWADVLKILGK